MLLIDFSVIVSTISIIWVNMTGVYHNANCAALEKYSSESNIPVLILALGLAMQVLADGFLLSGFWWQSGRKIACLLELPSTIVGAYVCLIKKDKSRTDIAFFNLQI